MYIVKYDSPSDRYVLGPWDKSPTKENLLNFLNTNLINDYDYLIANFTEDEILSRFKIVKLKSVPSILIVL